MVNHFFAVLYGYPGISVSGIYSPLVTPLRYNDTLTSGLMKVRGGTPVTAEAFAIQALKVVDASSYTKEIVAKDPRLTYRLDEVGVDVVESTAFLEAIVGLPGAVIASVTLDPDVSKTYRSPILTERAAAVIVGIVRKVNSDNGY